MLAGSAFVGFIPVRDLSAARDFYEGVLGLRVVESTPFALVVDANGTPIRLTPVRQLTVQPFTVAGWEVLDVAATAQLLRNRGVECVHYDGMAQDELGVWVAPDGDQVAWFNDPDGNTLSLTTSATN